VNSIDGIEIDEFYPTEKKAYFGINYAPGVYVAHIIFEDRSLALKIVKQE